MNQQLVDLSAAESPFFSVEIEMLRLSHWIDLTPTDQIKLTTALYCFQRNGKRVNNPKKGGRESRYGGWLCKGKVLAPKHLQYSA